jgi:hypothetical protein
LAQQPRYVQRASQILRIFFNAVTTGAWIHGSVGWFSAWTQSTVAWGATWSPNSKRSFPAGSASTHWSDINVKPCKFRMFCYKCYSVISMKTEPYSVLRALIRFTRYLQLPCVLHQGKVQLLFSYQWALLGAYLNSNITVVFTVCSDDAYIVRVMWPEYKHRVM